MALEEGDIILCTVERIVGTTVFVTIQDNGEGTIITSEIAPGRIRNLRSYVSPGRKIVCKILSIKGNQIHLSLRRVSTKEKKQVLEEHQKEKKCLATLKSLFPDKAKKICEDIKKSSSLIDFFEKAKTTPKIFEKYLGKDEIKKLVKILQQTKEKEKEIKILFSLSSKQGDGIKKIKSILDINKENIKINYIAAGKYSLKTKAKNYKQADKQATEVLDEIEEKAKQEKMHFEKLKDKK